MTTHAPTEPMVLIIAGHDPSGAAGIQADIETMFACGVRCASLITAITTQDTTRFDGLRVQRADDFAAQADLLLADLRFSACKIGLLGNADIAQVVIGLLPRLGAIPVVLDPILRAGTGATVADSALLDAIRDRLMPMCTVITPNVAEAQILAQSDTRAEAAPQLLKLGARNVLMTGADEDTPSVVNSLYQCDGTHTRFEFQRLAGVYHGSGCTLSASLAAFLARGMDLEEATRCAQNFTWAALAKGSRLGRGQLHPNRMRASEGIHSK